MATVKHSRADPLQSSTNWLCLWSILGILLSLYTIYVEIQHEKDNKFRALCDINEHMSCSKVFMSKYGKGFGLVSPESPFYLPNPIFGVIHYFTTLMITLFAGRDKLLINVFIMLAALSNIGSVYLGYVLFFVLHDVCVVCITIYVVNFFMLVGGIWRAKRATQLRKSSKQD
ncbi:Vitamin K epoxide reductase complex subunit 1-like protein 1 [Halotydeus destructor]|nr:Vitamin K epoxide reductase complex subunit 1-like protein 1 [Halotydeus destructor]